MEAYATNPLLSVIDRLFSTNVLEGDNVVIVVSTDQHTELVDALQDCACRSQAASWTVVKIGTPLPGEGYRHPIPAVSAAVSADVTIVATSLAFPRAFDDLTGAVHAAGKRLVLINNAPTVEFARGAATADPFELDQVTRALASRVSNSKKALIESRDGTELELSVTRPCFALTGTADGLSKFGSFPSGEAMLAVGEGTAEGTFVATDFGQVVYLEGNGPPLGLLEDPVTLKISKGRVVKVSGGRAARRLDLIMAQREDQVWMVGELGIGTNPKARAINAVENKFRLGTAHIALGSNSDIGWAASRVFGGTIQAGLHVDLVARNITLSLDGCVALKNRTIFELPKSEEPHD